MDSNGSLGPAPQGPPIMAHLAVLPAATTQLPWSNLWHTFLQFAWTALRPAHR